MAEAKEKMTQKENEAAAGQAEENTSKKEKKAESKAKKNKQNPAKASAMEEKIAEAKAENEKLKDQFLRTTAEYENYRRRTQEEKDAAFSNGVAHATEQVLPVLDTLFMAALAPSADEEYKKGVQLTLQKAQEVFKKLGIEEIECENKAFDPTLMNACMNEEVEGVESGNVTRVVQKGYTLNGRVIRHAMVAVAP